MATANVPASGEGMQAQACPCGNKISSWDTHQMCVMCLSLKHAQAALESSEECTHCAQFSLKVLRRQLAQEISLSSNDPLMACTAASISQEPMLLGAEAALSWGDQLDTGAPLSQELDEVYLPVGPSCHLVDGGEVNSDSESELLMSDEYEEDDSPLALSGRVAKSSAAIPAPDVDQDPCFPVGVDMQDVCKCAAAKLNIQ
ncbi:hypothetical protein LDENG_00060530 [Lucifuga dentata]|nr:hypothetical protein LDENG_00060530 [Lucifuga dentata]